ncbi:MAG: cyclase [Streptosporangiales bacterium]|nr:cyclase [Streptosporangiales bacterium]
MPTVEESIDVEVPVGAAYDRWTQFESFPRFMVGVDSIVRTDDTHLHWVITLAGVTREFNAEITEQRPDERIAWMSRGGTSSHAGVVTFHRLGEGSSRVTVELSWSPEDLVEHAGSVVGADDLLVRVDLNRFKSLVEDEHGAHGRRQV